MASASAKNTINEAAQIAAADPEVMTRAKRLMMRLFDEADYIIETGSSQDIAKLAGAVIPVVLRETTRAEQSEQERRAAEEYAQIRRDIAASLTRVTSERHADE